MASATCTWVWPGVTSPSGWPTSRSLPYALLRYRSELVIEDFGAPFSSVAVPWMTARPVLGVVQWLFAREKSAQYHLPFHLIEGVGVRSHRSMIAVSDDLGG